MDVTGLGDFAGTSLSLGGGTFNAGTLTFNSGGAVIASEDSSSQLAGTSTADSLDLDSAAGITNDASADLTVTNNADFAGASIALGNAVGDTFHFGTLTFNSGGVVTISEDSATAFAATSSGTAITVNSAGAMTDLENDAANEVTGTSLVLTANGGVGVAGTSIHTAVTNLDVSNAVGGGIFVTDTAGGLILTELGGPDTNAVSGVGGNGEIRANSPLTVSDDAITSGGMTYTASDSAAADDDLTVTNNATVQDTTGTLTLNGGDNVDIQSGTTIDAATTLTINADAVAGDVDNPDVGATVTIAGSVTAVDASINTGNDNDTILLSTVTLNLDTIQATNSFSVDAGGNEATTRRISRGGSVVGAGCDGRFQANEVDVETGDQLILYDTEFTSQNTYTIASSHVEATPGRQFGASGRMDYSSIETLQLIGGRDNDMFVIEMAGGLPDVVQISGGANDPDSDDYIDIHGSAAADLVTVDVFDVPAIPGSVRAPFELRHVNRFRVQGEGGDDIINNKTTIPYVLEGDDGDDIVVSGATTVAAGEHVFMAGGADSDTLIGAGGNVIFLPDQQADNAGIVSNSAPGGANDLVQVGFGANNKVTAGAESVCGGAGGCGGVAVDLATLREVDVCIWLTASFPTGAAAGALTPAEQTELQTAVAAPAAHVPPPPTPLTAEGESPFQNPNNPLDVDADGSVNALDALLVINRLNSGDAAAGAYDSSAEGEATPKIYYDVTGDRIISPLDVLLVINHLNSPIGGASIAEGESAFANGPQQESLGGARETGGIQTIKPESEDLMTAALVLPGGYGEEGSALNVPLGLAEPVASNPGTPAPHTHNKARQVLFASHASEKREENDATAVQSGGVTVPNLANSAVIDLEIEVLGLLASDIAEHWG